MNTNQLAPVFLDDQPVTLQDARPKVSAILAAVGKPDATQVKWLKSSSDTTGKTLRSEEVVDRTSQSQPIYLSSGQKGAGTGGFQSGQGAGKQGEGAGKQAGGNPSGGFKQGAERTERSDRQGAGKQPMAEESWAKPSTGEREGPMAGKAGHTSEESDATEDKSARDAPDALDKPSA